MLWFGLVWFLRYKPQTKSNRAVQCKSHPNSSEPSAVFCGFGLDWFGLRFFYWVGSVLNTPNSYGVCYTFILIFEFTLNYLFLLYVTFVLKAEGNTIFFIYSIDNTNSNTINNFFSIKITTFYLFFVKKVEFIFLYFKHVLIIY